MSSLNAKTRQRIKDKKKIVIKVGTSSLTYKNGKANLKFIDRLVSQIVDLVNRGHQVVLVSSGAIGIGLPILRFDKKPDFLPYKQAVAAVGQCALMGLYETYFHRYGQTVGQVLMTKGDSLSSKRYLYMKGTLTSLLELGVVPIINENDAVSVDEIKIGDNDTLSAIVASICEADLLIILSDIDGLYSEDPKKNSNAKLINEIPHFTRELFEIAGGAGTSRGTGGMYTKMQAAEICAHSGIDTIIANSHTENIIHRLIDGENIGTYFVADNVHPQLKRRKIIIGSEIKGKIFVDKGCNDALVDNGSSLLPVGILKVSGTFEDGSTVSVYFGEKEIARGISYYSSDDINKIKGLHTEELANALGEPAPYNTVIHRDNLLMMY